jgi:hypothetical protein
MIRLLLSGAALLALTVGALLLHTPAALSVGSPRAKTWFVVMLGAAAGVFLLTASQTLRRPPSRHAIWIVLLVAVALRLPVLLAPPFLSTDVFRYVWDGRVQAAGINPYRSIPADPSLAPLRDQAIYPNINRADYAPTIYPPFAQIVFATTALVWPGVTAVKVVMVGFECLAVLCLLALLAAAALPPERVLIYAWNPLAVWAFAGNGHVDAVAIGLLAAALLLRARRRDGWAGMILGGAILTKFLPAIVAPALWRRGGGWRLAICATLTVIALYGLYSGVGWRVFGFLSGYGAEEGLESGSGIWLLAGLARLITLPHHAAAIYTTAVLILLGVLGAWVAFVRRPGDPVAICGAAAILMGVLTFAISPHYPWYFAWLAVPSVLAPYGSVLWMSAAPVLLYLDTHGDRFLWPSVVFVPALLLAVADLFRPRLLHAALPIEGKT